MSLEKIFIVKIKSSLFGNQTTLAWQTILYTNLVRFCFYCTQCQFFSSYDNFKIASLSVCLLGLRPISSQSAFLTTVLVFFLNSSYLKNAWILFLLLLYFNGDSTAMICGYAKMVLPCHCARAPSEQMQSTRYCRRPIVLLWRFKRRNRENTTGVREKQIFLQMYEKFYCF